MHPFVFGFLWTGISENPNKSYCDSHPQGNIDWRKTSAAVVMRERKYPSPVILPILLRALELCLSFEDLALQLAEPDSGRRFGHRGSS